MGVFRASGPEFFDEDSCVFQIELFGERFTPEQLDPTDDDNPCNAFCGLTSISGIFLWDDLPDRCS